MAGEEIHVAPDRFEITAGDTLLTTELPSAMAVVVYDATVEAGALLHLRSVARTTKPLDATDTTLATELLLLDRCLESLRASAPAARHLQGRLGGHPAEAPPCRHV